jgi:hypothetical protein
MQRLEACMPEVDGKQIPDGGFVFDNQNAGTHVGLPGWSEPPEIMTLA